MERNQNNHSFIFKLICNVFYSTTFLPFIFKVEIESVKIKAIIHLCFNSKLFSQSQFGEKGEIIFFMIFPK